MGLLKISFILILLLSIKELIGQSRETDLNGLIELRIEFMRENQMEAQADYTNLFDNLEYYYQHPIDLNNSNAEELAALGLMNEIQIRELLQHIQKNGKLIAIEELQAVNSFDKGTILMIQPFCKISSNKETPDPKLATLFQEGRSTLLIRSSRTLELKKGFKNGSYLGDPFNHYLRYRFQYYNRLSIGVTAEKDAGEEFFTGEQSKGFDFYSMHFFLRDYKMFKQLAIGDFHAQFGQGLTFWSGLAFGGGLGIAGLKRVGKGLSPYTSAQESLFLRGFGSTLRWSDFRFSSFYSSKAIDGNIEENSGGLSSFYGNGLHRTNREIERKDIAQEKIVGGHLRFEKRNLELGITAVGRSIDRPILPSDQAYRKYDQAKQEQFNLGIDYSFYLSNILFYGETSRSDNNAFASLNGMLWMPSKRFGLGILQRNYSRAYTQIHSNALGTNSRNASEKGTYLNLENQFNSKIGLQISLNLARFNWFRYQVDGPSQTSEQSFQLNYKASKKLHYYFRFRSLRRQRNSKDEEAGVASLETESKNNYRLHLVFQLNEFIKFQNRIEWVMYSFERRKEEGFLIYQDLQLKFKNIPIRITMRYSLFESSSFDSRIYAYENDVLYAFSIPPNYGVGSRYYLLVQWKLNRKIDLWVRFDQSIFEDRELIGSGQEEIDGNVRSQLKCQLRIQF